MLPTFSDNRLHYIAPGHGGSNKTKHTQARQKTSNLQPNPNVIDVAGDAKGTMKFIFTDDLRDRLDNVRTQLMLYSKATKDGTVQLDDANATYIALNCIPCLFSSVRHFINGELISQTIYPAQDDTLIKRITKSQEYLRTIASSSNWVVSATDRLNHVSSDTPDNDITAHTRDLFTRLNMVESFNSPIMFPRGLSHRLEFDMDANYEKRFFQAAADKTEGTNYKLDLLQFYLRQSYVVIADSDPTPSRVLYPFKGFQTSVQPIIAATNQKPFFTIPKNATHIIVYFQHADADTDNTYSPTEFKCGATEDVKLTQLTMTYMGMTVPTQGYTQNLTYTTIKQDGEAYTDCINTLRLYENDAGGESIYDWGRLGRLYAFSILRRHPGGQATIDLKFKSAPTAGDMNIFVTAFTDRTMIVDYGIDGHPSTVSVTDM